jgi:hypothetical protein
MNDRPILGEYMESWDTWVPCLIMQFEKGEAYIAMRDGSFMRVGLSEVRWTRPTLNWPIGVGFDGKVTA